MYRYNSQRTAIGFGTKRPITLLGAIAAAFEFLAVWHDRRRQRLTLARLDDRMLRDIGMTSADVESEISKPFWR